MLHRVVLLSLAALALALPLLLGTGCGGPEDVPGLPPPPYMPAARSYAGAPPTKIRLTDVSAGSGITVVNHSGRSGVKEFLIEAVGPGIAWLDFDGDGLLDVFIPDGDVFSNYELKPLTDPTTGLLRPTLVPKAKKPERFLDQLWRNKGDGSFEDVAAKAGIVDDRWSFGATAFDYDGDGDTDVFVANYGTNALWRNNGDGSFTDVADELGVAGPQGEWTTCCAVGDMDGDGRLDLYTAAYSDPAAEVDRQRAKRDLPIGTPVESITGRDCSWRGVPAYCGPRGLVGQHDTFYRQQEDGTFVDLTDAYGLRPREPLYAFTTVVFDADENGLLDAYVANDSVESYMWMQERPGRGRIRFRERSDSLGVKYSHNSEPQASMGAAVGDFNQDGLFDIFVTNFSHDYNNLFLGQRVEGTNTYFFRDRGLEIMGQAVFYDLSWGCGWEDLDNDADLDLYFANGHVYKEIDDFEQTGTTYDQLNTLFECMEAPTLGYREIGAKAQLEPPEGVDPATLEAGDAMRVRRCSRAVAFADWNNDGRMDLIVGNMNETPTLILNTSEVTFDSNWVKIVLEQPGLNRDALGAVVEVEAAGVKQKFAVMRLTSFLGSGDPRLHVGLGPATTCTVRVIWPGQERASTTFENLPAGKLWRLHRESGEARDVPLQAFDVPLR